MKKTPKRGRPPGSRYESGRAQMMLSLSQDERDLILEEAEIDALPAPMWARSQLLQLARKRRAARERAARKNEGS